MKKAIFAAAAMAAVAIAAPASAEGLFSFGYTQVDDSGFSPGLASGRYHHRLNEVVGVEGEVGIGVKTDNNLKINYEAGVFGVAQADVNSNVSVFARAGYAHAEAEFLGLSDSAGGAAFGAGAILFFTPQDGVRFEYTSYDLDGTVSTYGISYVRRFGN